MTPSQASRILGFNASITARGVGLTLDDSASTFTALVYDLGTSPQDFAVDNEDRKFAELHILKSAPGVDGITFNSVLREVDGDRVFTVNKIEQFDIKSVFRCTVDDEAY